jgi:hypothetical protein
MQDWTWAGRQMRLLSARAAPHRDKSHTGEYGLTRNSATVPQRQVPPSLREARQSVDLHHPFRLLPPCGHPRVLVGAPPTRCDLSRHDAKTARGNVPTVAAHDYVMSDDCVALRRRRGSIRNQRERCQCVHRMRWVGRSAQCTYSLRLSSRYVGSVHTGPCAVWI